MIDNNDISSDFRDAEAEHDDRLIKDIAAGVSSRDPQKRIAAYKKMRLLNSKRNRSELP